MKIALAGSAGTGRSTIARRIAESIEHVPLTNIAKMILKEEGFRYGTEKTVEDFLATPTRQQQLFKLKQEIELNHENFVTDRSWIDLAAYCIYGMQDVPSFDMALFIDDCKYEVVKYDAIFHIPWGRQPLQANGTRTINPWFQLTIDSIICRLASLWKIEIIEVPEDLGNNESTKWILDTIKLMNPKIKIIQPLEKSTET